MNLTEALRANNEAKSRSEKLAVYLATGFTPLTLSPFLAAHLGNRLTDHHFTVSTGSYGDLAGNIGRIAQTNAELAAVCIEWDDLDPRLGTRRLSQITWRDLSDILTHVRHAKEDLVSLILGSAETCPIAVSLPHTPLPPLAHCSSSVIGEFEAELKLVMAEMQLQLVRKRGLHVLQRASEACFDLAANLRSGFPYTVAHASELAESLAAALMRQTPKKGIIIDLDDTLWKGILGEEGIEGVQWNLDNHAQHHGLFQQFLHILAAEGTLIAIASKNSDSLVTEMFDRRSDLVIKREDVFPVEANWAAKSESVRRIVAAWNISTDAVVFVDDSPLEIADVEAVHPGIVCRQFPTRDVSQFWSFMKELRELFAKDRIGREDALRAQSLRSAAKMSLEGSTKYDPEMLLKGLQAALTFDLCVDILDERALELINKTNQFNLNGVRITEPAWRKMLSSPETFVLTCTYKDKFGELGKIAVLTGSVESQSIIVKSWVMSCRAFARRIEYACLRQLFEQFPGKDIVLEYQATPRNGPMKDFLQAFGIQEAKTGDITISKNQSQEEIPALYHDVSIIPNESKGATHV